NISNGTNKAYYIKSAMDIDGVSAAGVIPRNRGVGTVDVFIMSPDGEPSQTLIDTVQERLSELREINVDIHVESLTKHNVNISVNVQPKKGYSFNNIYNAVLQSINNYFAHLNAGESFYKSSVAEYIRHTEGVDNFEFILFRTPDVSIDANCIAWPGVITINPREDGV
ncbi:MAG: baseplate J/gp47 family protein, partial [Clostridia bacterium]|nr:baseplate J/gp47 family protein [Clostridia bacterium]